MKKTRTKEQIKALQEYFSFDNVDKNSKVNFIKKWGMSPGYMVIMYK